MSDPIYIGRARNVQDLLNDLADDRGIVELLVVRVYKDEKGVTQFRFDHTPMESCFRMAGALLWTATKVMNA